MLFVGTDDGVAETCPPGEGALLDVGFDEGASDAVVVGELLVVGAKEGE